MCKPAYKIHLRTYMVYTSGDIHVDEGFLCVSQLTKYIYVRIYYTSGDIHVEVD